MPNLWAIFATGLLTGGITCMAVQGGLLAATIAQRESLFGEGSNGKALPVLSFLLAKLVAYTILGFILGWAGSFFQLSVALQAVLLGLVSLFMIGTALNMLGVHPVFRYFVIQPPKVLTRMIRNQSKSGDVFAPAMLGLFTIFIPCGTTQAMMALAIASGSPVYGALILASFVLGTSPLFFAFGYSIGRIHDLLKTHFATAAAFSILAMSLWNLNNAFVLGGSPISIVSAVRSVYCTVTFCDTGSTLASGSPASDQVTIDITDRGYSVDHSVIRAGQTITLTLKNDGAKGCAQAFTIPSLGIQKVVPLGTSATVSFVAPRNQSELRYTCGMGMFGGSFSVVKGG